MLLKNCFILPFMPSLKILLNLCRLSSKQETAAKCKHQEEVKSLKWCFLSLLYLDMCIYLSFYRNIKFETILNLCYIRPGMATKS